MDEGDWAVIAALTTAQERERVRATLTPDNSERFDLFWLKLGEAKDQPQRIHALSTELVRILRRALPDDQLPRWRWHSGATVPAREAEALELLFGTQDPPSALPPPPSPTSSATPSPAEVWHEATQRLLSAPAFDDQQLLSAQQDPLQPNLIRLERADGAFQLPAFQFGPRREPIPLVLAVNELLGADEDPWAAADWWLEYNLWLHAAPVAVLSYVPDDYVLSAALTALEGP
ncbi:MAG: hypothetical protein ACRDYZ_05670 [Acidimicrobiales bacterium]